MVFILTVFRKKRISYYDAEIRGTFNYDTDFFPAVPSVVESVFGKFRQIIVDLNTFCLVIKNNNVKFLFLRSQ